MIRIFLLAMIFGFAGCKEKKAVPAVEASIETADSTDEIYFPVTTFIKGQIKDIESKGINPIKYITSDNRTDSSWVKIEDMEKELASFLEPVIDTNNMKSLYTEKKFLDQTINAYTFTYDPSASLHDSVQLRHWDVYVDPDKQIVTRVYMLKNIPDNKIQQLTWQSDKWAKIVTISDSSGQSVIEEEILIKWDY